MDDSSTARFRLATGDSVEVADGTSVLLRLPGDRAHAVAHALADWSRLCALVAESVDTYEQPLADALARAAIAAGDREASTCSARDGRPTASAQRMAAAAVLRRRHGELSPEGLVAVVDAAAGYVDGGGDDAAVALLTAVGGEEAAAAAYAALVTPLAAHRGREVSVPYGTVAPDTDDEGDPDVRLPRQHADPARSPGRRGGDPDEGQRRAAGGRL